MRHHWRQYLLMAGIDMAIVVIAIYIGMTLYFYIN